jgi:negative regulator of flagellin synthesis FlgM
MKITPLDTKPVALSPVAERRAPAGKESTAEPSAKVEISQAAQLASLGGDGNFDAAKVAQMSKAIADGSFKANPDAIADKLIANAREQLAKAYR